jgi:hypothetical protein
MSTAKAFLTAVFTAVAGSCSSTEMARQELVVDSAGIRIVSSQAPATTEARRPQSGSPVAVFGKGTDPAGLLAEVVGAIRLSDGRLVVLEFDARELREYGADGTFESVWAKRGMGPGELQFPSNLRRLRADSVEVWDRRTGRIYVFTPHGELAREIDLLHAGVRPPPALSRLDDQRWIGESLLPEQVHTVRKGREGILTEMPVALVTFSLNGPGDTLTVLPGIRQIEIGSTSLSPATGYQAPWTVGDAGVIVGTGRTAEFHTIGPDGQLQRITRWAQAASPLDRGALLKLAQSIAPIQADDPLVDPAFLPDSSPIYKQLRSFDGEVWAGSATPFLLESDRWQVFDSDGKWSYSVELNPGSELLDRVDGYIVIREKDAEGVQTVAVYPFR